MVLRGGMVRCLDPCSRAVHEAGAQAAMHGVGHLLNITKRRSCICAAALECATALARTHSNKCPNPTLHTCAFRRPFVGTFCMVEHTRDVN